MALRSSLAPRLPKDLQAPILRFNLMVPYAALLAIRFSSTNAGLSAMARCVWSTALGLRIAALVLCVSSVKNRRRQRNLGK
jgi:hypothetical protein